MEILLRELRSPETESNFLRMSGMVVLYYSARVLISEASSARERGDVLTWVFYIGIYIMAVDLV